ncbi:hypothetical protein ACQ4PT_031264 [Festuca glaucescens]
MGRMGLEPDANMVASYVNDVAHRRLGLFSRHHQPPAPLVSPGDRVCSIGVVADAMANRGGGNPNCGRGQPAGGSGNRRGEAGFTGGRGNNFFEGGPSGTAGDGRDAGEGAGQQGNHFDGVFRVGGNRPPFPARGGYRQNYGYNRGDNFRGNARRNFGGQGNYNNRRFNSNSNFLDRSDNNRNFGDGRSHGSSSNASFEDGLTAIETQLVKEAVATIAKQLAESRGFGITAPPTQSAPSDVGLTPQPRQTVVPAVTPVPAPRQVEVSQSAETAFLTVAGVSQPLQVSAHGVATTEVHVVPNANNKKKGEDSPSESDGHTLSKPLYVLSGQCYVTEEQEANIVALVEETQPKMPLLVAMMKKPNVKPYPDLNGSEMRNPPDERCKSRKFVRQMKSASKVKKEITSYAGSSSSSGHDSSEDESLEPEDYVPQRQKKMDYVFQRKYNLTKVQVEKIDALVRKIQPTIPVLVVIMNKTNVNQYPDLAILKAYAIKYFPCKSQAITVKLPDKRDDSPLEADSFESGHPKDLDMRYHLGVAYLEYNMRK